MGDAGRRPACGLAALGSGADHVEAILQSRVVARARQFDTACASGWRLESLRAD